ncbi:aromatic-L-amino-acid decarboxylase [Lingula anatina]|uniref:Aromatic-L-amino-acid decarboxylase n=1 Tax=Lingula anatina TaxID=7574 RepID=A0A1S3KAC8_LINAN|nr:aromatic-L-amino-acid decarboxylase [Lingula anatina]|eukprot:XP_013419211.2 aromatic-L-amino-acid decarboxylase [Lingula anatina]
MDAAEFRVRGKEIVDMVADYLENVQKRPVYPAVQPGYMRQLLPETAPESAESWEDVIGDIERVIMPGTAHWNHPQFHGYFPSARSYAAICADMLSDAMGGLGFTWAANPACTELEMIMMDWLGKMLDLPEQFLFCSGGKGGGVIQMFSAH